MRLAGRGKLYAFLAAFFFSWSAVFTRIYESAGGEAMGLVLLRMQLAVLVFGGVVLLREDPWPRPRNILIALGIGAFQLVYNSALLLGFANASVALVVLLFYVYPILVVIGAWAMFSEAVNRARVLLIVLGMSGLVLIVGAPGSLSALGVFFGLTAAAGNCLTILGIRYLLGSGDSLAHVLSLTYLGPAVVTLGLLSFGVITLPLGTLDTLLPAIGFMTLGSIVPIWLFFGAVSRIGAGTASLFVTLEPLLAVIWAFALLNETMTLVQLVGGALVIAAVAGLSTQDISAEKAPP